LDNKIKRIMKDTTLFSWDNGTIIMVVVFGLVIIGLVSAVFLMMYSDKKR
jgi:hypothetical protein